VNWLDFVLLAILLLSTVAAARKGFSREVIGLTAALLGLVLGMWFYGLAGSFLLPWVSSPRVADLLGFLLIVFGALLVGVLLSAIVNRFLRTVGLSFLDRLLGAAFGLARGLLIGMALLTAWMAFGPQADSKTVSQSMLHSRIAPYVLDASHLFVSIAPMELKSEFLRQYAQVKSVLTSTSPRPTSPVQQHSE
jgi:membrane protein required for colicin V production